MSLLKYLASTKMTDGVILTQGVLEKNLHDDGATTTTALKEEFVSMAQADGLGKELHEDGTTKVSMSQADDDDDDGAMKEDCVSMAQAVDENEFVEVPVDEDEAKVFEQRDTIVLKMDEIESVQVNVSPKGNCKYRKSAIEAIDKKQCHVNWDLPLETSKKTARDSVRQMHSYKIATFPKLAFYNGTLKKISFLSKNIDAKLDQSGLSWGDEVKIRADDLVGASHIECSAFEVHFFLPGRGSHQKNLCRRHKITKFHAQSSEDAIKWVQAIQSLVKWEARVPLRSQRKIRVVVNPHSGKQQAPMIWKRWKPLFEMAGIQCDVEKTTYGGHAIDMGKQFDLKARYEAMVFIGGDGTVNEFLNGLLQRNEREWRRIMARVPISLLSAGTDNAFGKGVGTPTHGSSVYCILKRKIRPVDVVACRPSPSAPISFACCGASFGIGADIAMESEKTRWMGVHRYKWLKLKRGFLAPRRHSGTVKYVLSESHGKLQTFDEIQDHGAHDQHHVESCSIYNETFDNDDDDDLCKWHGPADAVHEPADEARFAGQWRTEEGNYVTIGAANLYFEAKYSHPSDGHLDMILVRKGNVMDQLKLGIDYITGRSEKSKMMAYQKVKAMIIEQDAGQVDPINFDGEVLQGPGPFKFEIVPSLFNVLSEK